MNHRPLHIVFTGGGTGGHLFPGLAVAEQLCRRQPQVRITFAGSGKVFERRHVGRAGYEYFGLRCRGMSRRPREVIRWLADNLAGYWAAGRFLDRQPIDAVVGLGGYASVPMARAAARRRIPLVLLEQNAVPGRATRWLVRNARFVCVAWAQTRSNLRCRCPVHVTGTPIRHGFEPMHPDVATGRLVVLGGSGGARSLNENVPRALYKLGATLSGWQIVHQTGEPDFEATRQLYGKLGLPARVEPFLDDMPGILSGAELAVCRAGGTTLAELSAAGVPAVLLPYPFATDDHQRRNAEVFAAPGGAVLLDGRELPGRLDNHLVATLAPLLADGERRRRKAAVMRRFARPQAAEDVAHRILELVGATSGWSGNGQYRASCSPTNVERLEIPAAVR